MADQDQDYKVINTPKGKAAVKVRNYTTGADEEAIMDVLMGANTTTVESTGEKDAAGNEIQKRVSKIDATVQNKYDRLLLERFVISVNDNEQDAVKTIYGMRSEDFHAVLDYVRKLTKNIGGLDEAQKKS